MMDHRARLDRFHQLLGSQSGPRLDQLSDTDVASPSVSAVRRQRRHEITQLCLNGIPDSPPWLRPAAWSQLLNLPGSAERREQYATFVDVVGQRLDESPTPAHDKLLREVHRDVERSFGKLAWFSADVDAVKSPEDRLHQRDDETSTDEEVDPFWARLSALEVEEDRRAQRLRTESPQYDGQTPPIRVRTGSQRRTRRQALLRPLVVYAMLNPGLSYVQGMNSIIGVLYWVFSRGQEEMQPEVDVTDDLSAEASAFFALGAVLSQLRDLYVPSFDGNTSSGLSATLERFATLLSWIDPTVAASLESRAIDPALYCFRWLTTLFANEFELPDLVRVWDRVLALFPVEMDPNEAPEALSPVLGHLIDLSLATVLLERPLIVSPYSTFPKIMARLQDPQIDGDQVDRLLSIAWDIRERRLGRQSRRDTWSSTATRWAGAAGSFRQRLGLGQAASSEPEQNHAIVAAADYELDDSASVADSESSFTSAQSPGFASRGQRVGLNPGPVARDVSTIDGKTLPPPPHRTGRELDGNVTLAELIEAEMPKEEDTYSVEDSDPASTGLKGWAPIWRASLSKLASSDAAASIAKTTTNLQIRARMQAAHLQQTTTQSDAVAALSKTTTNLSIQALALKEQLAEQGPERFAKLKETVAGAGSRLVASTGAERAGIRRPGSPVEEPFTPPRGRASSFKMPGATDHGFAGTPGPANMEKSWSGGGPKPLLLGSGDQRRSSNASDSGRPSFRGSPSTSPLLSRAALPSPPATVVESPPIPIGRGSHARVASRTGYSSPLYSEDHPIQSLRLQNRDASPSEPRLRRPVAQRVPTSGEDEATPAVTSGRGWQLSDTARPPRIDLAAVDANSQTSSTLTSNGDLYSSSVPDDVRGMFESQDRYPNIPDGKAMSASDVRIAQVPFQRPPRESSLEPREELSPPPLPVGLAIDTSVSEIPPVIDEDTPLTAIPGQDGVAPQRSKILRRPGAMKKRHSGRQASIGSLGEGQSFGTASEGNAAETEPRRSSKRFSSRTIGDGYDADELLAAYGDN